MMLSISSTSWSKRWPAEGASGDLGGTISTGCPDEQATEKGAVVVSWRLSATTGEEVVEVGEVESWHCPAIVPRYRSKYIPAGTAAVK